MTRAAIYARFSSDLQNDRSIEDQVAVCRDHAAHLGADVVEIFTDYALTGTTMDRPGIQQLMAAAESGGFDLVVTEALDRVSRDQEGVAHIFKRLSFAGVVINTISEGPINELHIGLKGTMNALFIKDMAKKVRRGQRGRAEAGFAPGGLCYGYRVVKEVGPDGELVRGKRAIDEEQAAIVRRIYEEYVAGISPRDIAKRLNDEGIKPMRAKAWSAHTILGHRQRRLGILCNDIYAGRLIYNVESYRTDPTTGRRKAILNPESEWTVKEVPDLRIIDDLLWRRAKAIRNRKGQTGAASRRPKRLLSGMVLCGCCGGKMAIADAVDGGRMACSAYRSNKSCDNGRKLDYGRLEKVVLDGLRDHLGNADAIEAFVDEYRRVLTKGRKDRRRAAHSMAKRQAQLEREIKRLVDAICDGTATKASNQRLVESEAELDQLKAGAGELKNADNVVELLPSLPDLYRRRITDLEATLQADNVSHMQAVGTLRTFVSHITATPEPQKRGRWRIEVYSAPGQLLDLVGDEHAGNIPDKWLMTLASPGGLPKHQPNLLAVVGWI